MTCALNVATPDLADLLSSGSDYGEKGLTDRPEARRTQTGLVSSQGNKNNTRMELAIATTLLSKKSQTALRLISC
jgi:hypothetical protein